jgi:hypothetical protein
MVMMEVSGWGGLSQQGEHVDGAEHRGKRGVKKVCKKGDIILSYKCIF